jgi:hypothetical protein
MNDYLKKALNLVTRLGCLASIAGPLLAIILYPRAKWLFALVVIGIAIVILQARLKKDPTPSALAGEMENLLAGTYYGHAVDDFENRAIRDPTLREHYLKSMTLGGAPETWVRLSNQEKDQMRTIIRQLRELPNDLKK